jgi:hypothetical protein
MAGSGRVWPAWKTWDVNLLGESGRSLSRSRAASRKVDLPPITGSCGELDALRVELRGHLFETFCRPAG